MSAKPTSGPWRVDHGYPSSGYPIVAENKKHFGGSARICSVRPANRSDLAKDEALANACLIAAAPELLAALEAALPCLESNIGEHDDVTVNVRSAIAAVKGENDG